MGHMDDNIKPEPPKITSWLQDTFAGVKLPYTTVVSGWDAERLIPSVSGTAAQGQRTQQWESFNKSVWPRRAGSLQSMLHGDAVTHPTREFPYAGGWDGSRLFRKVQIEAEIAAGGVNSDRKVQSKDGAPALSVNSVNPPPPVT